MTKEMEKVSTHGEEAVTMLALLSKISVMDSEKCTGIKILTTKENGFRVCKTDKDKFGKAKK